MDLIRPLNGGIQTLEDVYSTLDAVSIVTLAPELNHADEVVRALVERGITVSVG